MGQKVIQKRFITDLVCPRCTEMKMILSFVIVLLVGLLKLICNIKPLYEELTTRVTPVGKAIYDEEEKQLKIMELGLGRQDH
jgi:hypothetical protein